MITYAGIGSTAFTLIPYIANLVIASRIKEIIKNNAAAKGWFQYNTPVFTILVVISGGSHAALSLVSSNIFGLMIFGCGLTQYELKQMGKLKVIGTVIIENIPQLICQILYSFALGGKTTSGVQLAFIASALSITASTLSYLIQRDTSDTKVVQYYLSTQCSLRAQRFNDVSDDDKSGFINQLLVFNHRGETIDTLEDNQDDTIATAASRFTITDAEKMTLIDNRGRTLALGEQIAEVFGIPVKNIEIGHSMITKYGIITHVVHFVYNSVLEFGSFCAFY